MTAQDIIQQLKQLDPSEIQEVRAWIDGREFVETPEFLAAVAEGVGDFEAGRFTQYTIEEFRQKWAGVSK